MGCDIPQDVFAGNLTWDVVEQRLAAGALAILPIGAGAKQHGWHLPMRSDAIQAEWLAMRLAEAVPSLIWPVLTYGHYPAFASYAGSCSLSAAVFEALMHEVVTSLLKCGPPIVLIVDTGISTIAPIDRAVGDLKVLHLKVHEGPRYREAASRLATQAHGGHADELETSRLLALAPDLVDMRRAAPGSTQPPGPGPLQHADPNGANYSQSGSIGDPRAATAEKGWTLLNCMADDMIEAVSTWQIDRP